MSVYKSARDVKKMVEKKIKKEGGRQIVKKVIVLLSIVLFMLLGVNCGDKKENPTEPGSDDISIIVNNYTECYVNIYLNTVWKTQVEPYSSINLYLKKGDCLDFTAAGIVPSCIGSYWNGNCYNTDKTVNLNP